MWKRKRHTTRTVTWMWYFLPRGVEGGGTLSWSWLEGREYPLLVLAAGLGYPVLVLTREGGQDWGTLSWSWLGGRAGVLSPGPVWGGRAGQGWGVPCPGPDQGLGQGIPCPGPAPPPPPVFLYTRSITAFRNLITWFNFDVSGGVPIFKL